MPEINNNTPSKYNMKAKGIYAAKCRMLPQCSSADVISHSEMKHTSQTKLARLIRRSASKYIFVRLSGFLNC